MQGRARSPRRCTEWRSIFARSKVANRLLRLPSRPTSLRPHSDRVQRRRRHAPASSTAARRRCATCPAPPRPHAARTDQLADDVVRREAGRPIAPSAASSTYHGAGRCRAASTDSSLRPAGTTVASSISFSSARWRCDSPHSTVPADPRGVRRAELPARQRDRAVGVELEGREAVEQRCRARPARGGGRTTRPGRSACRPRTRGAPPPCGGCRTGRGRSSAEGRGSPTRARRRSARPRSRSTPASETSRVVCRVEVPTGPAHRRVSSTAAFTSDRSARTCSSCAGFEQQRPERERDHVARLLQAAGEHQLRVRDDLLAASCAGRLPRGAASTTAPSRRARRRGGRARRRSRRAAPRSPRRRAPASPGRPRSSRGRASGPRSSAGCPATARRPARA